ncbi:MAG TPA: hypothetical protein VF062_17335 [Candidatus Limnocylindrales bacterium]
MAAARDGFVTGSSYGVTAITWGSMVLEFALAIAILLGPQAKRVLLVAGPLFHAGIAVHMGLVSFLAAISAALLLALLPSGACVGFGFSTAAAG